MISTILIVASFTIGEKVSWKSRPWHWLYPFSTRRALYLLMLPSVFSFILNTHLLPMIDLLTGRGTKIQVLLLTKALYFA